MDRIRVARELVRLAKDLVGWDRYRSLEEKARRRKGRKKYRHDYQVGDVLYSSWGYDQTNISFYEVVGLSGDKSIVIREIGQRVVKQDVGSEYVVPTKGRYIGKEMTKRVSIGGSVKITSSAYAWKWDGKPKSQDAPGWGH